METTTIVIIVILIVIIIYIYFRMNSAQHEGFEKHHNPELVLFFSDKCGHCITFKDKWYQKFINKIQNSDKLHNIKIIHADEPEHEHLFSKYNIQYVPTGLVRDSEGTHYKIIEGLAVQNEDELDTKVRHCEEAWNEIKNNLK